MRLLLFTILGLLLLTSPAAATITLDIDNGGVYGPLQPIIGDVEVVFNELIHQSSTLTALIDNQSTAYLSMQTIVNPPSSYSFINQLFGYNISASGTNTWSFFPDESFTYTVTAEGTCGGTYCYDGGPDVCDCPIGCGPPYPCFWQATFESDPGTPSTVNAGEGLVFIYDSTQSVSVPGDTNNDTTWIPTSMNSNVLVAAHEACGGQIYVSFPVSSSGWVYRTLLHTEFQDISGTTDKEANIEPFQHTSLNPGQTQYNGGPGGIFKNGVYQYSSTQVEWDGPTGYIRINNFDGNANYVIVYLPPNGPNVCAFTTSEQMGFENWQESISVLGITLNYNNPYLKTYSQADLQSLVPPPSCPPGSQNCSQETDSYTAYEIIDPQDSISLSWDGSTASAVTSSLDLVQDYSVSFPLSLFTGLNTPVAPGNHTLVLSLAFGSSEIAFGSEGFATCQDNDGDGFCLDVTDCDDSNPSINPLGSEVCDGKDNDCDGSIDEDFWEAGSKLGNSCGVGLCSGIFVCTPDGENVICNNKYVQGEFPEYCGDDVDNDCDGITDETVELINNQQTAGCICKDGQTRICGSNIGECSEGIQTCVGGEWGACIDQRQPLIEACNQKDDDCDGIIDNVGGGSSPSTSGCQCYGGSLPVTETCNDIDDDCNSAIDEGVTCCEPGQTRSCGSNVGVCQRGIQDCSAGSWGLCQGEIIPRSESCFDGIDNDCDGSVDEGCQEIINLCSNDIQDPGEVGVDCGGDCPNACGDYLFTILLAAAVLLIIIIVAVIQLHNLTPT